MREYMPFTDEIRERLLGMPFDQWSSELIKMVPKYGKTMERSAKEAYDKGLIERRIYLQYAQGMEAIQERQALEDKEEAAKKR